MNMDRLDCDRMFVAVMELGSFARAADRLHVSAGQASKLVTRLEQILGAQLLSRTTRALSPTELGRAYYERMRDILTEIDALDGSINTRTSNAAGRLRLTVPASLHFSQMVPLFTEFMELNPKIEIDVHFSDRAVSLVDEGFDLAIRVGAVNDLSLITRKLGNARIVAAASPSYIAKHGTPSHPSMLANHTCIIDTNFREPLKWRFHRKDCSEVEVVVTGRLFMSSAEACLSAAENGFGIVRVPSFMAGPKFEAGKLVPLLLDFEDEPIPISVIYPPTRHLAVKLRVFIDFLAARFKDGLWWDKDKKIAA